MEQYSFESLGTLWKLELPEGSSSLIKDIKIFLSDFEKRYSRFDKNSWLSKISQTPATYPLNPTDLQFFKLYFHFYKVTNGLFTPLIGQNLVESGYDSEYSLSPKTLTQVPKLTNLLTIDNCNLTIKKQVSLDFGGIGKGLALDLVVSKYLTHATSYYLNAGGDILLNSPNPIDIALENPLDNTQAIGVASIKQGSLAGSSFSRRSWGKYHHILNPQTRSSPDHLLSTWVVADTAVLADTLATCLFLVSPETLLTHFKFEYLLLDKDFKTTSTQAFPAKIFHANTS